jgi:hypothetical protein
MDEVRDKTGRVGPSDSGEVWTDADGRATVVLPPSVRERGAGFNYELSPLGPSPSAVWTEMTADDRFTIVTDQPHVKVAGRVTALNEKRS